MLSNRFRRRHKYKLLFFLLLCVLFLLYTWSQETGNYMQLDEKHDASLKRLYPSKEMKAFLLVLIMTAPKNRERRDAIRETWLAEAMKEQGLRETDKLHQVLHYFVIGTKGLDGSEESLIEQENVEHKDLLILENFRDSYEKLTQKLGLTLKWIDQNVDFKYVFKGDDDTFARLDVISEEFKQRAKTSSQHEYLYYGYFYGRSHVKKSGPWKETDWKLCDYYLPYARGGGYILSTNVVSYVAENFHRFKLYLSEDVSMGTWVAPLEVQRQHDIRFDTEYKSRGCSNTFIVSHKQSISDMKSKQRSLLETSKLCVKEFQNFNGYEYNWDVPPSQCCVRSKQIP